jgi:UDP-N-acetylmuramyl pentapeptide phosphotransferase/UDP-N-acetylglucosamine-1-phosphate transferase
MTDDLPRIVLAVALAAFGLVGVVRQLAVRRGVMDHPSDRSSHAVATPRGGGLGLLLAALPVGAWYASHPLSWTLLVALLGVAAVATVGWMDDRRGLPVRTRLAVHLIAGATVGIQGSAGAATAAVAIGLFAWWTFWSVSSINLVNFMDGINGLVASQIAVFALSLAAFPSDAGPGVEVELAVAAACLGFLPWNFPRARIFLGDVGSGSLGCLVPVLALLAMKEQGIDIVRAHLPLLPLFGDATMTIVGRWRRGERLTAPHRSHLYQRLANGGMGHSAVTVMYTIAAILGAAAAHRSRDSFVSLWTLAYASLTVLAGFLLHRRATDAPNVMG